ncbi:aldehyde dehydrogenase family protein [Streptomyces acidicola]|uniref:aldehyde dehydrogenase family protein n=1 Tax=Streptomyces acidicola TaxID=2596892 RepID=UPI003807BE5E
MELGGKGAMVVLEDTDLDKAVADALSEIYLANGEACVAASRLLVHDTIYDELVDRFVTVARTIRVGDATEHATEVGPLLLATQRLSVRRHIEGALAEGATIMTGDEEIDLDEALVNGYYFRPTLVADPGGATAITAADGVGHRPGEQLPQAEDQQKTGERQLGHPGRRRQVVTDPGE